MTKENLKDYLVATASCFPAFKPTKIENSIYIDGGYTDNLPINLAIKLGATNIIAVDMGAIGITKKINKEIPITYIRPNNKLGSLLVFEKDYTRYYLKLGYYDTLKKYKQLDGNKYTFKRNSFRKNYDRLKAKLNNRLLIYEKYHDKILNNEIISAKKDMYMEIIETLMDSFCVSPYEVYRISYINSMLKRKMKKDNFMNYNSYRKISIKQIKSNNISKELIYYIYNLLLKNSKSIKRYIIMYPKVYLCAVYLLSINNA